MVEHFLRITATARFQSMLEWTVFCAGALLLTVAITATLAGLP